MVKNAKGHIEAIWLSGSYRSQTRAILAMVGMALKHILMRQCHQYYVTNNMSPITSDSMKRLAVF